MLLSYQNLPKDAAVGVDPWCVSVETAQRWEQAFSKKNQRLIQLSVNLVDEVWKDRPPAQYSPVIVQPLEFAGQAVSDKLVNVREKLTREKAYGIIITALDEVSCSHALFMVINCSFIILVQLTLCL